MWVYFWTLYSVSLTYVSVFMPAPGCFFLSLVFIQIMYCFILLFSQIPHSTLPCSNSIFFCISFFSIFKIFYCYSITVVCLFSPCLHPTPAEPTSSATSTLPLDFVHVSFIAVPVIPSPHCPLPTPLWLLLDCS